MLSNSAVRDDPSPLDSPSAELSELVHALAQPLTLLSLSIEDILSTRRGTDEYRRQMRKCLEYANELQTWIKAIRDLAEAAQVQEHTTLRFDSMVGEAISDLAEFASDSGRPLVLANTAVTPLSASHLTVAKALRYVLLYAIEVAPAGPIQVAVDRSADRVQLHIETSQSSSGQPSRKRRRVKAQERMHIVVAQKLFEAMDGTVAGDAVDARLLIEASLPRSAKLSHSGSPSPTRNNLP
jgi:hypothetical protein